MGLGVAVLLAGGALYARHLRSSRAAAVEAVVSAAKTRGGPVLRVPHVPGAITLDGDTDDPGWVRAPGPARTGSYELPNGKAAIPHSETRLVWGDGYLYLALYASDEDIESHTSQADGPVAKEDAFRVVFSRPGVEYELDVSPAAVIADSIRREGGGWDSSWNSGAHASKEMDGTINNPKDRDEEWAIELAIPLESLGLKGESGESIGLSLNRCDTLKGAAEICASWGEPSAGQGRGTLVLE